MIKILVEANNLSVQKKCEFISYLYNNYDEIDYKFIEKWSGLAPSTVRNYRYRGDKTITEKNKQLFTSFIQIVEKNVVKIVSLMYYMIITQIFNNIEMELLLHIYVKSMEIILFFIQKLVNLFIFTIE